MTDDRMALAQLLEKGSDSDLPREMIGYVAQRLMQIDVDGLVGAGHGSAARALQPDTRPGAPRQKSADCFGVLGVVGGGGVSCGGSGATPARGSISDASSLRMLPTFAETGVQRIASDG